MSAEPRVGLLSIGEVLARLRPDFPDVTISKIRFLESEGLVQPARTPAGYRQFSGEDLARLRYVLRAQREQFLPLRVIRERLEALETGAEAPSELAAAEGVSPSVDPSGIPTARAFTRPLSTRRYSRAELLESSGLEEDELGQLEAYGLVVRAGTAGYDADALEVGRLAAALGAYGLGPRHLRAFKTTADREIGLIEQAVATSGAPRGADARARSAEAAADLATLAVRLHAALLRTGLVAGGLR